MIRNISLLIAALVALSGCTDGGSPQTATVEQVETTVIQTAPATTQTRAPAIKNVAEEGGSILGSVTDDEFRPIVDVTVFLAEFEVDATTDEGGRYAFTDVPVGTYTLTFEHPSYETAGRKADVAVGVEKRLDVILEPLPFAGSYHETVISKGLIVAGEAFVDILFCGELGGQCLFTIEAQPQLHSIVIEEEFIPTLPPNPTDGNTLYYQLRHTDAAGALYGDGYWQPRQKRTIEGDWSKDEPLPLWLNVTCHLYWVCFQQTFTNYVTLFYVEKAPEDFTALPP